MYGSNPFIFSNFLFLEFKNRDLSTLSDKTGYEIGLKEEEEIFLKLNQDIFNETISERPKNNCLFDFVIYNHFRKVLIVSQNEKVSNRLIKMFNFNNFNLSSNSINIKLDTNLLLNNQNIILTEIKNIPGGVSPPVDFIDVSTGKIKNLKVKDVGSIWRFINEGLNIFGICKNNKCKAYNKEVIYRTYLNNGLIFVLNDEIVNIKCPMCERIFKPKTCGFYECEYQFKGKKIENGFVVEYDSKTKETNGDKFEYFDPFGNKEIQWIELKIFLLPIQEIKYIEI